MGWEVFIIPIIGVAVWIISTLLRGNEDAKKPGAGPAQRKGEKVTDLDRFLREVQRRKQSSERGTEQPPPPPERRREERPAPPPREEPVAVVEVAEPLLVATPMVTAPLLVAEPMVAAHTMTVHEAPALRQMPVDVSARSLQRQPDSRALAGLRELLGSRDGLRKAMTLQAILGPPLARRGPIHRFANQ
jgi:hypothetical protein